MLELIEVIRFMNYLELVRLINTFSSGKKILFFGHEIYLFEDILNRIKTAYKLKDESLNVLDVDYLSFSQEEIYSFLDSFSLFSSLKMLVIRRANDINFNKEIVDYLNNATNVFVLIQFNKKDASFKKLQDTFISFELKKLDYNLLEKWIFKKFESFGKTISKDLIRSFIQLSEYNAYKSETNLFELNNLILKISSKKTKEITLNLIEESMNDNIETNIYKLQDAMNKKNFKFTMDTFNHLYKSGINLYPIIPMLNNFYFQLSICKLLNYNLINIKKELGINSNFVVNKLIDISKGYSLKEISNKLDLCIRYEKIFKTYTTNIYSHIEKLLIELQ